jgi:hypothetical protein
MNARVIRNMLTLTASWRGPELRNWTGRQGSTAELIAFIVCGLMVSVADETGFAIRNQN